MKLEGRVYVNRPVAQVFGHLSDLERSPEWAISFGVVERRKLTAGPVAIGTRFHAIDRLFGFRNVYEVEITGFEQDRYLAATWSEPICGGWEAHFVSHDDGTDLRFSGRMSPTGALKLAAPVIALWGKVATRRDLNRFKRWVEANSR